MKDSVADADGEFVSSAEVAKLESAQAKLRQNATPAQKRLLDEADAAFAQATAEFDEQLESENKLRRWATDLLSDPSGRRLQATVSDVEELRDACHKAKRGEMFWYAPKRGRQVQLIKTVFGAVDRLDRYVAALERTVIDVTNNSQFTPLKFWGLIGLAFKRTFKR